VRIQAARIGLPSEQVTVERGDDVAPFGVAVAGGEALRVFTLGRQLANEIAH